MAFGTLSASQTLPERDTSLVTFVIKSDGEVVSANIETFSISIQHSVNKIGFALLRIKDGDIPNQTMPVSDEDWFIPGKEIEIQVGYHLEETTLFKGIVVRHEVRILQDLASSLLVEIREPAYKMTRIRRSNYYPEIRDSDLFAQIAEHYSIPVNIDTTSTMHPMVVQHFCTDWDFMVSRADQLGLLTTIKDGKIVMKKPSLANASVTTLSYTTKQIVEFEAKIDARNSTPGSSTKLWAPADQTLEDIDSQEPEDIATPGNLRNDDIAAVLHDSNVMQWYVPDITSDVAQQLLDARDMRNRLSTVRGRVCINGYEGISPMDWIAFDGFGDRFNGQAFVSRVRHEIISGLWLTHLEFGLEPESFGQKNPDISAPPASALGSAVHGLHIGVVTKLQATGESDGQHICVRIPYIQADGEGIWARWSTGMAGKKDDKSYGMVFRPEIGDEVVIGFVDNDPNHAIILGTVFSQNRPAPVAADDQNPEKGIYAKAGMKVVFNDTDQSITISTEAGNQIVLSDSGQGIMLESQHGGKIQMDASGILIDAGSKPVVIDGTTINIG